MPDLSLILNPPPIVLERFWAKVNKEGIVKPHMDTPCWEWTAHLDVQIKYGVVRINDVLYLTHRVSWMWANGRVPDLCVLHHCDTRHCIRPSHLYEGTRGDNNRDLARRNPSVLGQYPGFPVKQFSLTGEFIKEWKNANTAARFYGIGGSNVRGCVAPNPTQKTAAGFIWTR